MLDRDRYILKLAAQGVTLAEIARRLAAADPAWALTPGSISRVLHANGKRRAKVRKDAGEQRKPVDPMAEAAILAIKSGLAAAPSLGARRKPGKALITRVSTRDAIAEAVAQGAVAPGSITPARFNRRMREGFNIHQRGAEGKRSGPDVVRRFAHKRAGAMYQFDGTPLGQFYIDASGDFEYVPDTDKKAVEKAAGRTRAHVLAFVDDCSRCLRLGAYDGETTRNVLSFAREMFTKSSDPLRPFSGLPRTLYMDNGSGANSDLAMDAWRTLGVKAFAHEPLAPWSKGKVEAGFRRTNSFQELTRGRRLRGFEDFRSFLRDVEIELNNRPMADLAGRTPLAVFIDSAGEQAIHGGWRYATTADAFWRRLMMTRLSDRLVTPELTLSIGEGEIVQLPYARPFCDWIGRRVAVSIDSPAGRANAWRSGAETLIVCDPTGRREYEVPRVPSECYATLLSRPVVETAAQEILRLALAAVEDGRIRTPEGRWIGANGAAYAAPEGVVVEPATGDLAGAIRPVVMVRAHDVKVRMNKVGMFDPASFVALMNGADEIAEDRLERYLDTGVVDDAAGSAGTAREVAS